MYSFSYLEPVCCSMSRFNCCFLTSLQISQEAGQVVWYSHLFQNFPQFIVIHTIKGFGIVNKAEIDVFLELSCFFIFFFTYGNVYLSVLLSPFTPFTLSFPCCVHSSILYICISLQIGSSIPLQKPTQHCKAIFLQLKKKF